jgi:hypothetical protein
MKRLRLGLAFALVMGALFGADALAQPLPIDVPPALEPYRGWVLQGATERLCPLANGDVPLCAWPSALELALDETGGRFSQRVEIGSTVEVDYRLPGAAGRWPLDVRVDGKQVAVSDAGDAPSVRLGQGTFTISGRFAWNALPERLEVPNTTGLVTLAVLGKDVPFPKRDEYGQLWLQSSAAVDEKGEQLSLFVSRKIEDGVPLIATTLLRLRVSGRAREINLGRVLLPGMTPLSLASELPARLEEGGELRVQARAGTYRIEARARSTTSPQKLGFERTGEPWPETETWVWQANEALRQVELSGVPAVDASRTELEADWHGMPTFVVRAGDALVLSTVRRGEPTPPPNRLSLQRELWLDIAGDHYTVRDRLDAQTHDGFRIDLLKGQLGHVAAGGEDLLITKHKEQMGVELRQANQSLIAEWRTPASRTLPAVGWSQDVQSLQTTLHLAPGYSLLAASGVDTVSESWLQDWDLYSFFFVLVIAIAALRLIGVHAALLALLTLVLCHQQYDAPRVIWLVLLAFIALLRVLPAGLFRGAARAGYALTALTLLLSGIPFVVNEVRSALYPQLAGMNVPVGFGAVAGLSRGGGIEESSRHIVMQDQGVHDEEAAMPMEAPAAPPAPSPASVMEQAAGVAVQRDEDAARLQGAMKSASGGALADVLRGSGSNGLSNLSGYGSGDSGSGYNKRAMMQDPEATVQTGPGVPTWQWKSWQLSWSGPVDKAHEVTLYLITPGWQRVLGFARVLALLALAYVLLRAVSFGRDKPPSVRPAATVLASAAVLMLALFGMSSTARADELPSQAMLDELQRRLLQRPACEPSCVSIDTLGIDVARGELSLKLEAHAIARGVIALPGPATSWVPRSVTIDGKTQAPVALLADGFLHVRVEPGVHIVEARGPLPQTDTLTLALSQTPHRATVSAEGYKVDGVREDGQLEGTLQISRLLGKGAEAVLERVALPPFLFLTRRFELGPSWTVMSRLDRVTPPGTPVRVSIPLLAGESVTDSSLEVVNGAVQASLGRDEVSISWSSTLKTSERIALRAAQDKPYTEQWTLTCGPIWHCEHQGIAPTARVEGGVWRPSFWPWPGEEVSVSVSRPESAGGQSVTIDNASLTVSPGKRMQTATLQLNVRASRGASLSVELPAGARVQKLTVSGQTRPIRLEKNKLSFTLGTGGHLVEVEWQLAEGFSAAYAAPKVVLDRGATNVHIHMAVPSDRWLLWASGPSWGPAILFWGYLLLVIAAAVALARTRRTPLGTLQWILLGVGLTQVPVPVALCVAGWFFAMAQRERMGERARWVHNLTQLALIAFTFIAAASLYEAVRRGLLMQPDMQVLGAGSYNEELHWYADRIAGALPSVGIVSAPLWVYRVAMLLWSLWLAVSIVRWVPWAFRCFKEGGLWKRSVRRIKSNDLPPTPPETTTPA